MSIRENDPTKIEVGSVWRHVPDQRVSPTRTSEPERYLVGEIRGTDICFGPAPQSDGHRYGVNQFMRDLVPMKFGPIEQLGQITAIMGQAKAAEGMPKEIQELLTELEI
jgi:hypothetical protein